MSKQEYSALTKWINLGDLINNDNNNNKDIHCTACKEE